MPKFRLLTHEELMEFEKEFIDYLIVNGITAEDWQRLKKEEAEKAVQIIGLFSDVILEGTMRKIQFLEIRLKGEVHCYHCLEDKIILMALKAPEDSGVDFTDSDFLENALQDPPEGIQVYTVEKEYSKERELELFEMIQQGCSISDGQLYKALSLAHAASKDA